LSDQTIKPSGNQPDTLRRKLVKGGLATPVILATLASKPVLGAPWNCTISGQISGNVSTHGEVACTSVGNSKATFAASYPNPPAGSATMISDLFPDLTTNYVFFDGTNLTSTSTGNSVASINQILNLGAPLDLEYTIKALVLLLNAKGVTDPAIYPLTEAQAKQLYVAAATHSAFVDTNPDVNWDDAHVKSYIDLLFH